MTDSPSNPELPFGSSDAKYKPVPLSEIPDTTPAEPAAAPVAGEPNILTPSTPNTPAGQPNILTPDPQAPGNYPPVQTAPHQTAPTQNVPGQSSYSQTNPSLPNQGMPAYPQNQAVPGAMSNQTLPGSTPNPGPATPNYVPPQTYQQPQNYQRPQTYQRPQDDSLAITALVLSIAGIFTWITALVGAILGHVVLSNLDARSENQGRSMALAAVIVGWIIFLVPIVLIAIAVFVAMAAVNG